MVIHHEGLELRATTHKTAMPSKLAKLTDHVLFRSEKLAARYARRRIPMATLYEAYFDGDLDIPGDMQQFIADRQQLVSYQIERRHLEWLLTHFVPEALIHAKANSSMASRSIADFKFEI